MKKGLTVELCERFGMDGNGKLAKVEWSGRNGNEITVKEFEAWSGVKLESFPSQSTEFSSTDYKITLIDEQDEDFDLTLEVKNGVITHSYY